MIVHGQSGEEAIIQNISGVTEMQMKQTAKAFSLLIDKLYTKKEDAVVRELASNARDAMVDAGKSDEAFFIEIPNTICHELVIRDNGTGLSKENVMKFLGTIFESSKESSNKAIGAYGLGSKSPFAVTDSYMIESRFNGELHTFSFFRAKGATPSLVHISTMPTDEPNGLTFRVPSSPSRYAEYKRSVAAQLFFFDPKPIINGLGGQGTDIWDDYGKAVYDTPAWKIIKSVGLRQYYGEVLACMGGVNYPIKTNEITSFNEDDDFLKEPGVTMDKADVIHVVDTFTKINRSFADGMTTALTFNIGDLEVPPSREALEYDTQTCYNIYMAMKRFNQEFEDRFIDDIVKATPNVTTPKELQEAVRPFYNILRWSSGDGRYGNISSYMPEKFLDRLKSLKWQVVNSSNTMPSYFTRNGALSDGKIAIGIYEFNDMLKNLSYDMPHVELPRVTKHEHSFITFNGVVDPKSQENPPATITNNFVLLETSKQSLENTMGYGLGYERVTKKYERHYKEWTPAWNVTSDIAPEYNDVNIKKADYTPWIQTKIGAEMFNKQTVIVINDAPKKDFKKTSTWAVKAMIAKDSGRLTGDDEDKNNETIRNTSIRYYAVRALETYQDDVSPANLKLMKEFFAAQPEDMRPRVICLSDIIVPKAKSVNGNVLVFRGVHHAEIGEPYHKNGLEELNSCNFNSIAAGQKVQPGFLVFKATDTEKTYLNPECTIEANEDEIMKVLCALKRHVNLPFADLYRLTPMTTKKLHEYEAAGFQRLDTFLKATFSTKMKGRHQFLRRLKHFAVAWGMAKNIEIENIHRYSASYGYRYTGSVLEFAKEVGDADKIRIGKYLKVLSVSAKGGSIYTAMQSKMNVFAAFGTHYAQRYQALTMEDAATLVAHEVEFTSNYQFKWAKEIITGGRKDWKGRTVRTELSMIVDGAELSYNQFVKAYTEENFKTVLFSSFYSRDSKEYDDALNHLKKVLA